MKKVLLLLLSTTLLLGCKSNEEKAAELLKDHMSKTLLDFASYEPIETKISPAKCSVFTDSACWEIGTAIQKAFNDFGTYASKEDEAERHMNIWGPPTLYSSRMSDNEYYKYKQERDQYKEETAACAKLLKELEIELITLNSKLDTTRIIGWEITHRFRCKTRGGDPTICDIRYVVDDDFSRIMIEDDLETETVFSTREVISMAMSEFFNKGTTD